MLKIGKETKIAELQSEEDVGEVSEVIEKSPEWAKLLEKFPLVNIE